MQGPACPFALLYYFLAIFILGDRAALSHRNANDVRTVIWKIIYCAHLQKWLMEFLFLSAHSMIHTEKAKWIPGYDHYVVIFFFNGFRL